MGISNLWLFKGCKHCRVYCFSSHSHKYTLFRRIVELLAAVVILLFIYYKWTSTHFKTSWIRNEVAIDLHNIDLEVPSRRKTKVGFDELRGSDCEAAFSGTQGNGHFEQTVKRKSLREMRAETIHCEKFIEDYGFNRYPPPSDEERDFPLAFTILFHQDFDQVIYLLRAVYRPHNVYCLSVDLKTDFEFIETVRSFVECFPNIIMASKMERIVYAGFERLKADVNCMVDLMQHPVQWKYVMNMVGQQFPLRTNLEMVRILKIYNGSSEIEVMPREKRQAYRFWYKYVYKYMNGTQHPVIRITSDRNPPPPHGIHIRKGSVFGSFARNFVQYVVSEPKMKDFLDWCETVYSPDEYFWASIQFGKNLDVPGGYKGLIPTRAFITTYASWPGINPCATKRVRLICIFSTEDLPHLDRTPHLFANKFYVSHHPAALHCLDERMYNFTLQGVVRDLSFYQSQVAMKPVKEVFDNAEEAF